MSQGREPEPELLARAIDAAREATAAGLDQARAQRAYRAIDARLEQRRAKPRAWRWPLLLGASAAAVAAALVLVLLRPSPQAASELVVAPAARVVFRSGELELRAGSDGAALSAETTALEQAAVLELAPRARVDLEVKRAARLAVFGPARLRRGGAGAFSLEQGRAQLSVEPHAPGAPYTLRAGEVEVAVLGTEFSLTVEGGKLVGLEVMDGLVEVRPPAGAGAATRRFAAGEGFGSDDNPPAVAPLEPFAAPWWREGARPAAAVGYLLVESEPAQAMARLAGQPIGATPLMVRWPAGAHDLALDLEDRQPWQQAVQIVAGQLARVSARLLGPAAPAEAPTPPAPARRGAATPDPWKQARALLDARRCTKLDRLVRRLVEQSRDDTSRARAELLGAECALRAGKQRAALARYQRITARYPETQSGEAALFEAAKLRAELGQTAKGLAGMERYLERYPAGRFAEPATMRRCELLTRFKRLDQARACLERYRKDFPGGLRAPQAVLLLATIARVEGRWADAAWLYRDFLARAPASPKAEAAHYQLIQCLRWARLDGVEQAVEQYLARYPDGAYTKEVSQWRESAASAPRDR